jgi:nucleotide-binding universal stress UspA family protein
MSGVVCAIRGGPYSQPTIAKAISVAKGRALPLYFLYVVNLDFLGRAASTHTHTINLELEQMGEFILMAAQSQAAAENVVAHGTVRHGIVSEEIVSLCHEVNADYLVLGRPQRHAAADNVFTRALLNEFIASVAAQTGAAIIMPDADES